MKTITDYFDGVFCINLERREDRWFAVLDEFHKHGLKGARVTGIDGNPDNLPTQGKSGDVGCTLSHIKCVRLAKLWKLKSVLIFEDDVEFRDNANTIFDENFANVPDDWDMLYLGGNYWGRDLQLEPQMTHIAGNVYKTTHTLTTHAYALKETMYDAVIERLSEADKQVDVLYVELQSQFNVYAFYPNLAWQRADKSDISGKSCNYAFMKDWKLTRLNK